MKIRSLLLQLLVVGIVFSIGFSFTLSKYVVLKRPVPSFTKLRSSANDLQTKSFVTERNPSHENFSEVQDAGENCENEHTGTIIGSAAIVTGTALGGGFLGLPFYTSTVGFFPSSILLVVAWLFLNAQAFLFTDLCLDCMKRNDAKNISVHTLACESLGNRAGYFLSTCFFLLLNATLVAQIAKAGDILRTLLPVSSMVGSAFTSMVVAFLVFYFRGSVTERINSGLTFSLFAALCMLICKGFCMMNFRNLTFTTLKSANLPQFLLVFQVLLQFLRFHEVIPVVCNTLGGDEKKIKKTLLIGSLIPLIMMLGWNTVACGLVSGTSGDPLQVLLQNKSVGLLVSTLSMSAILTTMIGGFLALEQFFSDLFTRGGQTTKVTMPIFPQFQMPDFLRKRKTHMKSIMIRTLTVIPSLCGVIYGPGAFYAALEFAGAYPGSILFSISPPLMFLQTQRRQKNTKKEKKGVVALLALSCGMFAATAFHHGRKIMQLIV